MQRKILEISMVWLLKFHSKSNLQTYVHIKYHPVISVLQEMFMQFLF